MPKPNTNQNARYKTGHRVGDQLTSPSWLRTRFSIKGHRDGRRSPVRIPNGGADD